MLNIGAGEIGLILVLALLILGPKRLPEMARGIGKFVREFRRQTDEVRTVVEREFYRMDQQIQIDGGKEASPNGPPKLPGVVAAEAAAAARAARAAGIPSPALGAPTTASKDLDPPPPATPVAATDASALLPQATPAEGAAAVEATPPAVPVESTRSKPVAAEPAWEGEPNGLEDLAETGPLDPSFARTQKQSILSPESAKELVGTSSDSKSKVG